MPRTTKNPPVREDEHKDDSAGVSHVDDAEPDESRIVSVDDDEDLADEDDEAEDIDLDDLAAMEGPDA
jgi:hypothetical protein